MAMIQRAVRPTISVLNTAATAKKVAVGVVASAGFHSSRADAAPLRETEQRIKSVKNIEKITKSMKMIASTKLNKAQRAMAAAKAYGAANNEIFVNSEAVSAEGGRQLFIVVSSDKGLCGGIHSSVTKRTKLEFNKLDHNASSTEAATVVVLGEKSKAQLARTLSHNFSLSFNQIGKDVPTFADATAIADQIIKSNIQFDKVNLVYNKYVSALSFESDVIEVFSENALRNATQFKLYEQEEDVTKDLAEFAFANAIYAALVEGHASEINSKRNAMDNASKNAGEMISSLNMLYNRGRQAAITNDLVDIITGASAL